MEEALERARARLGLRYPAIIDGKRVETEATISSVNPARPSEVVGIVGSVSLEQARSALSAAERRFDRWRRVPPAERADVLFRAAELVRRRRDDFNALLVLEVGKTWIEADADTAEAIDFLEFYGREAIRYSEPPPLPPVPGERNVLHYIPLGVGLVIPPWNFAFAIMAGMTTAAIVAGNTVLLKPSSDSPVIAAVFVDLLHEAGLPPGVVNFVPGSGRTIGDALVLDPRTRFIAFTGSKEVGLHINELAAKTQPGQKWIKRVIAEMGGRTASSSRPTPTSRPRSKGWRSRPSASAGQKCSACSRAIVEAPVYDEFLARLRARVAQMAVGDPADPRVYMGPVVNEGALRSILEYVETGKKEGRLVTGGRRIEGEGFYLEPTVIADVAPDAVIAQEEIFGPVLAVIKARDYDDALAIANNTEFGLTGSVYSTDEAKLERARDEFFVGNLYFNRKSTGALVGGHPFGGFNMSGTDSKAGGYDYLLLFTQAKAVSKKL